MKHKSAILWLFIVSLMLPATIYAASCEVSKLTPVKYGDKSDKVKVFQNCLEYLGYKVPAASLGKFDTKTTTQFKNFLVKIKDKVSNSKKATTNNISQIKKEVQAKQAKTKVLAVKKFSSVDEFKKYLQVNSANSTSYGLTRQINTLAAPTAIQSAEKSLAMDSTGVSESAGSVTNSNTASSAARISETNVQVVGIDEPDIAKTDGQNIYYSPSYSRYWWGWDFYPGYEKAVETGTNVVKAYPAAEMKKYSDLSKKGDLMISDNNLIVLSSRELTGFDKANPEQVAQKWQIKIQDNNYVAAARLYNGKIYLVTQNYLNQKSPCPIKPLLLANGSEFSVACNNIYHPTGQINVDSTFTAFIINPATGQVEKNMTFVGSANSTIVYMSKNALYISYSYVSDPDKYIIDFFVTKTASLLPSNVIDRIKQLANYDISSDSKMNEVELAIQKYTNTLNDSDQIKLENELENRLKKYYQENMRKLETSSIAKIGLKDLTLLNTGTIPGYPLNQFSFDEYQDNLRVATTIGGRSGFASRYLGFNDSINDVYVLNGDMNVVGKALDMGKNERIYSVRFIEDKGYVVTFKETDPLYVLDLKNPSAPVIKGELKIPGYSAYLHPINKDKIIGIGKEDNKVKISLFDVSNPANPVELSNYLLDEYYSQALNNHHAFLMDNKYQVFFLPGDKAGYIISYKDNNLILQKAISDITPERALYLDDQLYLLDQKGIIVLNENNWEIVKQFDLK